MMPAFCSAVSAWDTHRAYAARSRTRLLNRHGISGNTIVSPLFTPYRRFRVPPGHTTSTVAVFAEPNPKPSVRSFWDRKLDPPASGTDAVRPPAGVTWTSAPMPSRFTRPVRAMFLAPTVRTLTQPLESPLLVSTRRLPASGDQPMYIQRWGIWWSLVSTDHSGRLGSIGMSRGKNTAVASERAPQVSLYFSCGTWAGTRSIDSFTTPGYP